MLRKRDVPHALAAFKGAGYDVEIPFPHWLGKVRREAQVHRRRVQLRQRPGQRGQFWFAHAVGAEVLGISVALCPAEELLWSSAFVQERERYDGAEVLHLLHARGLFMDWPRLIERFGRHWPVLFSHLILFKFAYPDRRGDIPDDVMDLLAERLRHQQPEPDNRMCLGTLLSRQQYLFDLDQLGYADARLRPHGAMTPEQTRSGRGQSRRDAKAAVPLSVATFSASFQRKDRRDTPRPRRLSTRRRRPGRPRRPRTGAPRRRTRQQFSRHAGGALDFGARQNNLTLRAGLGLICCPSMRSRGWRSYAIAATLVFIQVGVSALGTIGMCVDRPRTARGRPLSGLPDAQLAADATGARVSASLVRSSAQPQRSSRRRSPGVQLFSRSAGVSHGRHRCPPGRHRDRLAEPDGSALVRANAVHARQARPTPLSPPPRAALS